MFAFATPAAHASCAAANQYNFSFSNQPAATLSYAGSYIHTASNALGAMQNFTVSFTTNGLTSATYNFINPLPAINTFVTGANAAARTLVVGGTFDARTANIAGASNVITVTYTMAGGVLVRDASLTLYDIDYSAFLYLDIVQITGTDGANTYTPSLSTPFGNSNAPAGVRTAPGSSVTVGSSATPVIINSSQAAGNAASGDNSDTGNLVALFPQPVNSITVRFGNAPRGFETATFEQAIGISGLSFCPMPNLTVTKTSAPWSDPVNGTTNPKLIPGGDAIYSLTIANANTSPVDLSTTVLTDVMPADVTFYNGDIDDAGPLTTNFEFIPGTSGLSFAAANLAYSNNGGATYTYVPVAGYDANVNALRFAPTGSLASNSSFTIRFRARIK